MTGQVIPMPGPRRRIVLEQLQYVPPLWLLACPCGESSKHDDREDARRARREHQAEHDRAERAHPAGKGRPGGGAA